MEGNWEKITSDEGVALMAALGLTTLMVSSWEFHAVSADESCNAVVDSGILISEDEDSVRELVMLSADKGVAEGLDV